MEGAHDKATLCLLVGLLSKQLYSFMGDTGRVKVEDIQALPPKARRILHRVGKWHTPQISGHMLCRHHHCLWLLLIQLKPRMLKIAPPLQVICLLL